MKNLLSSLLLTFVVAHSNSQTTKTYYTCPMHPKVVKSAPGDCPICGMTLVKKTVTLKKPSIETNKHKTTPQKAKEDAKKNMPFSTKKISKTILRQKPQAAEV